MKKQKLSLQQLRVSSFITESKKIDKQTVKGGNGDTEEGVCYSLNGGCGENQTDHTYCGTGCLCPKDVPTYP